jgi:hypothetical protein
MSIEETIQFLTESAIEQEAKLARLEENSALLDQALCHLAERQKLLEIWAVEVQRLLEDLQNRPFRRRRKGRSAPGVKAGCAKDDSAHYGHCRPAQRPPRA